jgi:O-antigen/teichoic acid export membrane protein
VVIGKVITATSRLAATALLARLLTQEEMGAFGLAFSFVIVGAMAGQLGLQGAVVRLVAESMGTGRQGRARAAVRAAYRYATLGTLAVAAFLLLGGGNWLALRVWDSSLLAASMAVLTAWVLLWSCQVLTSETFRGFQDLRSATLFGGVISWLLALGLLFAVWLTRGEITFRSVILILIASTTLSLFPALNTLRRRVRALPPGGSLARGELFSISIPMWITALTGFALAQSDLWILGAFVPKEQIAVYFSAMQLVALVSMSLLLVNLVVPPFIADLYARGERRRLQRILRTTATLAGMPAFLVLLAFVLFGAPILGFVYGPAFREGAVVLALLSLGKLVNVWTGSCGVTMSMTGHQTRLMVITIVTSTLTVGGCLAVVRAHGMVGVASVVAAGTVLQNLAMWIGTRYFTGLWTHVGLPRWSEARELFR